MSAAPIPQEFARMLTTAQRAALNLVGRVGLSGLRPNDNMWPAVCFSHPEHLETFDGEDVTYLYRNGFADASLAETEKSLGFSNMVDAEIIAGWDWKLTPLGLAVRAALTDGDANG
jgi:hypothetical protein